MEFGIWRGREILPEKSIFQIPYSKFLCHPTQFSIPPVTYPSFYVSAPFGASGV
jgi:hypothetical protein